jgi:hypothetical protein
MVVVRLPEATVLPYAEDGASIGRRRCCKEDTQMLQRDSMVLPFRVDALLARSAWSGHFFRVSGRMVRLGAISVWCFCFVFHFFSMRGREQLDMDSGQGDTCHSEDSEVRRKLS